MLFKLRVMIVHGMNAKRYSMLSRSAFIESNKAACIPISPGGLLEIDGPRFIGAYDFIPIGDARVNLEQPKLDVMRYQDGIVMGGTNFIITDGCVIHPDQYIPVRDVCPAELSGIAKLNLNANTISLHASEARHIKKAVSLLGSCTGNYAHWLTETLPKLLIIDNLERFNDYPLLVDNWIHPNFIASINLVKKKDRVLIRVRRWETVKADSLIDVAPPAYVPPEYRVFIEKRQLSTPSPDDFPFSRMALDLLRDRAHHVLKITLPESKNKLFLHRSRESCGNTRHVKNIEAIERLVKSYGYTFIEPAKLSFVDQVAAFASASKVVSPLGAALSNMIFTPKGCTVLGLSPYYESASYYYFSNFMGVLGHDLHYVLGKQINDNGHPFHRDYEIDLDALKLALDLMDSDFKRE